MRASLISPLRPGVDETLMSFLSRVQVDAEYTDEDLHLLAAGVHLQNARAAERRDFDWAILARFFNATEEELWRMSERSWLFGRREERFRLHSHAPWVRESGYGAHCPCCLRESGHWRKSWLRPDALVCIRHDALLARHCPCCDQKLAEAAWSRTLPLCPACGGHLSLGVRMPAPAGIMAEAVRWSSRFDEIMACGPLMIQNDRLAFWAAGWRAARMLDNELDPVMRELAATLVDLSNLGSLATGDEAASKALRFAQISLAAHRLDELRPTFTGHYWMTMGERVSGAALDKVVRSELFCLAEMLGMQVDWRLAMCQVLLTAYRADDAWSWFPAAV